MSELYQVTITVKNSAPALPYSVYLIDGKPMVALPNIPIPIPATATISFGPAK